MTLLEFIKEIPFITIFLVGFGIFELVQLLLGKREPTESNIVIDSLMISVAVLVVSTNLIAYLVENEPPIIADSARSIIKFIFFSIFLVFECVFLVFECVFYKREKGNKREENTKE